MSQDFYFLLMPGFSAIGFISAIEPLRVANRFRGELYRWHVLSADGGAVLASNGMSVNADAALEPLKKGATLLVVAGFEPLKFITPTLEHWLRRLDNDGVTLGAIDTGSFVLAEAGLLDGHRLTLHWEAIDAFKESYPQLSVTQELFEIDRRRITSAGGTASIDLMLDLIAQAQKVLEQAQGIRELAQAGKNQLTAPLKVGAIYTVGPYLFPHLIPQLHRVAPQMPLYIEENFTHVLRDKLRNGELDAIIIALPFNEADVLTLPLYDEPFYVLMPAQHPWTKKESIDAGLLNDKSLLLLGEGHCFRDQVLEACPTLTKGNDGAKHTTVESSSLETIRHMVASGLGISILPLSAVDSHHYAPGVIEVRPLTAPVPFRTVAIAWRASFPRPKAIEILADSIRLCSVAKPAAPVTAG